MAGKGTTYVLRPRKKSSTGPPKRGAGPRAGKATKQPQVSPKQKARRRIKWRQIAVAIVALAVGTGMWAQNARESRFERAKERAVEFLSTRVREPDSSSWGLFAYLHRRFGLVLPMTSESRADGSFEIFRRVDDPRAMVESRQIAALTTERDRIAARALHCDRIPLPEDWITVLRNGSAAGGDALTHSVLATEWSVENGCVTRPAVQALQADQIAWLVTAAQQRDQLGDPAGPTTETWIEAIAMLCYVGSPNLVRPEWLEEILRIQNDDGGWPSSPTDPRSNPRATALALWVLLEHLKPKTPPTPWIQQIG